MKLSKIVLVFVVIALSACASGVKRGVVAMKITDTDAHVGVGQDEVKVGDHVELYRNVCTGTNSGGRGDGGGTRSCKKESTGHGEVTQILNPDYSVVKFPKGTEFSEGDMIEKHAH